LTCRATKWARCTRSVDAVGISAAGCDLVLDGTVRAPVIDVAITIADRQLAGIEPDRNHTAPAHTGKPSVAVGSDVALIELHDASVATHRRRDDEGEGRNEGDHGREAHGHRLPRRGAAGIEGGHFLCRLRASCSGMGDSWPRVIFHVDMDAFYAAVEQRDDPSLLGRPVVVGGLGPRGVVSTASYEARPFGVKSAIPMHLARERCPHAVFLPGRMERYVEVSRQLRTIFDRYSPTVEPLSLDEAFLDMSGTERLFGPPESTARRLQDEVWRELSLPCSVGVATIKYVAKVASDLEKPRGLTVVPPGMERRFLAPLPVERLWGVGPKSVPRLHALGLRTIGDVARASPRLLAEKLGDLGRHIATLADGRDDRDVDNDRQRKSVGSERTFDRDIRGVASVREALLPLVDEVAASLRREGLRAGGVRLKLKYADFTLVTRQARLETPAHDAHAFLVALDRALERADTDRPMRLVGMAATDLARDDTPQQENLFDADRARRETLARTLDHVNKRFGDGALRRASSKKLPPKNPL
jgi:DNA polymerase-4